MSSSSRKSIPGAPSSPNPRLEQRMYSVSIEMISACGAVYGVFSFIIVCVRGYCELTDAAKVMKNNSELSLLVL